VVLVEEGLEVGAAAGFVESGCSDDDKLLALAEALGMDGGLAADHADGGELGDLIGDSHECGYGAEGLGVEGSVEAGHDDTLAEVDEFDAEGDDGFVEELDLVDADDIGGFEEGKESFSEAFDVGYGAGLVSLVAVTGDGGSVVAEVDVGLEAGDALASDTGALEAADELLGFAGEHGACDDFETAWDSVGHFSAGAFAGVCGYPKRLRRWIIRAKLLRIFSRRGKHVFAGVLEKVVC
jgi:hypothetical protein